MRGLAYYSSPVGVLLIESIEDKIVTVNFLKDAKQEEEYSTTVIERCIEQLEEYFFKGRKFFTVDLDLRGTDFQKKVWNELLTIPFGTSISYEALAIRIGNIKSILRQTLSVRGDHAKHCTQNYLAHYSVYLIPDWPERSFPRLLCAY